MMAGKKKTAEQKAAAAIKKALSSRAVKLDLSDRKLTTLPASIGKLTQLRSLNLFNNKLTKLPASIGRLRRLETLDLSCNPLTALPKSIGNLCLLRELSLNFNVLGALPNSLSKLRKLESLQAVDAKLKRLPTWLGKLGELRDIYIQGNRLQAFPASICRLRKLRTLCAWGNEIGALPKSLGKLSELADIIMESNRLRGLPESIGKLHNLRQLRVPNNRLERLPEAMLALQKLSVLHLHENPRLRIPDEILGPTWQDTFNKKATPTDPRKILEYYFRTLAASQPLNEAKLILVGRGETGKTCIVNRLVRGEFVDTTKTQGISVTRWPIRLKNKEDVTLHVWDFGGQEIMHATHQFFLTQRSVYVLVLNGRQGGEDSDAEYWLQLIESFGGSSPVIVVLNKIAEQPFDVNRRRLQAKYPSVQRFIRTDCKGDSPTGIEELRSAIEIATDNLDELRVLFPASWIAIKDRLSGMAERGENYITFERYRELCAKLGEKSADAQEQLAGYLHSLGIALNYKDDPRLHGTHVLSPHWVTNGIYKILNWAGLEERKGVLQLNDLSAILDAKTYPTATHVFLIDLMRRFELSFQFPDDALRRFLVPQLLDKQEPDLKNEFSPAKCLNFEDHYNVLPEGLLPRFIVRTNVLSEHSDRWRTGVVLEFERNRALVRADGRDRKTFISINGPAPGRRRLLAIIRSDLERIHADIKKLEVVEMVPVQGSPHAILPYEKLLALERSGIRRFPEVVDGNVIEIDVQQLLDGLDVAGSKRRDLALQTGVQAKRLFYSYSHKDEALRNELETHLKLLQRQGLIAPWHDRRIGAGDEWKDQIDRNLEIADIVLLLVSSDFIASDYCWDKEMVVALQRHDKGNARVIPIILRDVDWHSAPFAKLQALPTDGVPITLADNRDSAWKDVAVGIRAAAQELRKRANS